MEQELWGGQGPLGSSGANTDPSLGILQTQPRRTPPRVRFVGLNKQSSMQTRRPRLGQLSAPLGTPNLEPTPTEANEPCKLDKCTLGAGAVHSPT